MPLLRRLLGWPRRVQQPRRERDSPDGYAEVHAVPASHLSHPFPALMQRKWGSDRMKLIDVAYPSGRCRSSSGAETDRIERIRRCEPRDARRSGGRRSPSEVGRRTEGSDASRFLPWHLHALSFQSAHRTFNTREPAPFRAMGLIKRSWIVR
jgi:hypothetical protein